LTSVIIVKSRIQELAGILNQKYPEYYLLLFSTSKDNDLVQKDQPYLSGKSYQKARQQFFLFPKAICPYFPFIFHLKSGASFSYNLLVDNTFSSTGTHPFCLGY